MRIFKGVLMMVVDFFLKLIYLKRSSTVLPDEVCFNFGIIHFNHVYQLLFLKYLNLKNWKLFYNFFPLDILYSSKTPLKLEAASLCGMWLFGVTFISLMCATVGFPGSTSGKDPTCQWRRHKRHRFIPWVGKYPRGGHDNPLHSSCLEDPIDRGAWWATVHKVANTTEAIQ